MKKVFTLITAIVISIGSFAQQVPNGGFEAWTNPAVPDYWGTLGNIVGFGVTFPYLAVRDTNTYVQGHSSLLLITDTLPPFAGGNVVPSAACLGTLSVNTQNQYVFSGIPYTKKPDSLYFSVKYTPAIAADSGLVLFTLKHAGTSIFGGYLGGKIPSTASQWLSLNINLVPYYSGVTIPDTLVLAFVSSTDTGAAIFGAKLWIDAVHFDASINTGITSVSGEVRGVNAYPNPTTDRINIAIEADEVGSQIQLFDMEGRLVYTGTLNSATSTIDTRSFTAGVYSIRVNSIDQITTYKGKITVSK